MLLGATSSITSLIALFLFLNMAYSFDQKIKVAASSNLISFYQIIRRRIPEATICIFRYNLSVT
jgi:hypothetical protein